jgi:hypothetical protein
MSTDAQHIVTEIREKPSSPDRSLNTCREIPLHRYAWLEHENGRWHFLTSLFADPAESTRRWSDKQQALAELINEGWVVVRSYPEPLSTKRRSENRLYGYGLMRTIH